MATEPTEPLGPDPAEVTTLAEYVADLYREISHFDERLHDAKEMLRTRLYALRVAVDPEVRARVESAIEGIELGRAREGALSAADVAALRDAQR